MFSVIACRGGGGRSDGEISTEVDHAMPVTLALESGPTVRLEAGSDGSGSLSIARVEGAGYDGQPTEIFEISLDRPLLGAVELRFPIDKSPSGQFLAFFDPQSNEWEPVGAAVDEDASELVHRSRHLSRWATFAHTGDDSALPIVDDADSDPLTLSVELLSVAEDGTATVSLHIANTRSVWYHVGFSQEGGASKKIGKTDLFTVGWLPIWADGTVTVGGVKLPPGAQVSLEVSKFGPDPDDLPLMLGLDVIELFVSVATGTSIADLGSIDLATLSNLAVDLLNVFDNAGVSLLQAASKLQICGLSITDGDAGDCDWIGAARELFEAVEQSPELQAGLVTFLRVKFGIVSDQASLVAKLSVLRLAANLASAVEWGNDLLNAPSAQRIGVRAALPDTPDAPPVSPDLTTVRQIDWLNRGYDFDGEQVTVTDGRADRPFAGGQKAPFFQARVMDYGDLTGDGVEDAAIVLDWSNGSTATYSTAQFFTIEQGMVRLLAGLPTGDRGDGGQVEVDVQDGRAVVIRNAVETSGVGVCCATHRVKQIWTWTGGGLVEDESSRERLPLSSNGAPPTGFWVEAIGLPETFGPEVQLTDRVSPSQYVLTVLAQPGPDGSPIESVDFLQWTEGAGWTVVCQAREPIREPYYQCDLDLGGWPKEAWGGTTRLSFVVHATDGSSSDAPDGIRKVSVGEVRPPSRAHDLILIWEGAERATKASLVEPRYTSWREACRYAAGSEGHCVGRTYPYETLDFGLALLPQIHVTFDDPSMIWMGRLGDGTWGFVATAEPTGSMPIPREEAIVCAAGGLNVRETPSRNAGSVTLLPTGGRVSVEEFQLETAGIYGTSTGSGWYRIAEPAGWVASEYLQDVRFPCDQPR